MFILVQLFEDLANAASHAGVGELRVLF